MPVHGEYKHLIAQARIARDLGIEKDHIFIIETGDVLEFDGDSARVNGRVRTGNLMVNGLGVGDVGNVVLRDRQKLGAAGIVIVVFGVDTENGFLSVPPEIVSRGFVYMKEADDMIDESCGIVTEALEEALSRGVKNRNKLKDVVKDAMNDYIWKTFKRSPMILPIIVEQS